MSYKEDRKVFNQENKNYKPNSKVYVRLPIKEFVIIFSVLGIVLWFLLN